MEGRPDGREENDIDESIQSMGPPLEIRRQVQEELDRKKHEGYMKAIGTMKAI